MSLETRLNRETFTGNGTTTAFPFSFKVWEVDQVRVYAGADAADVTASCTVTINDKAGGVVTFATPPAPGTVIAVCRKMPFIQEDRYISGTRFDPHEVEDRFDQDCAERQELRDGVDRAVKVAVTDSRTPEEYTKDYFDAHDEVMNALGNVESAKDFVQEFVAGIPIIKPSLEAVAQSPASGLYWVPRETSTEPFEKSEADLIRDEIDNLAETIQELAARIEELEAKING